MTVWQGIHENFLPEEFETYIKTNKKKTENEVMSVYITIESLRYIMAGSSISWDRLQGFSSSWGSRFQNAIAIEFLGIPSFNVSLESDTGYRLVLPRQLNFGQWRTHCFYKKKYLLSEEL